MTRPLRLALLSGALVFAFLAGCAANDGEDDADEGDDGFTPPVERESIVGTQPYTGPTSAEAIDALCSEDDGGDTLGCYLGHLEALLAGEGAEAAFSTLENLTNIVPEVRGQAHPLAHDLGRYAFEAYGSIRLTMEECSYKVFAGCFHGALEGYFSSLERVTPAAMEGLCPSDNRFREYTCLHGVGHGLMLNTNYDMNGSLELCDSLPDWFAQGSCHGGIFMQNMVGFFESLDPDAHHHAHGAAEPDFKVDEDDPYYPCNAIDDTYKSSCWLIQTSLILHFNRGDFRETAEICAVEPDGYVETCFRSYGRDVAPYTDRNLQTAITYCDYPTNDTWKGLCMAGYVAESILNYVDPQLGLAICAQVPGTMKTECYRETGQQARHMFGTDAQVESFCAGAEDAYIGACRSGGQLAANP